MQNAKVEYHVCNAFRPHMLPCDQDCGTPALIPGPGI